MARETNDHIRDCKTIVYKELELNRAIGLILLVVSNLASGTEDGGSMNYGTRVPFLWHVRVMFVVAPSTTLNDVRIGSVTYEGLTHLGTWDGDVSLTRSLGVLWHPVCGHILNGTLSGACTDQWNNRTANDWRCRQMLSDAKSWKPGSGHRVESAHWDAVIRQIDETMLHNLSHSLVNGVGPSTPGWRAPGPQRQSVILGNNVVHTIYPVNGDWDIKGFWCIQRVI